MADPILIDDGGSLRIRQFPSNPNLDSLLDGHATVNNPASPHDFNTLRVEHHFQDGTNHLHPPNVGKTGLSPGDIVTIASLSGPIVTITVNAATVDLDLSGNAVVEAESDGGERTYRITNADVVQTVTLRGTPIPIFDNGGASPYLPSVFTIVAIGEK